MSCPGGPSPKAGGILQRPVDLQLGIVPDDAAFVFRRPEVGGLVEELGVFAEHHEAVREAGRNPHLALVLRAQAFAYPLAEGRRAATQVDGYVEYLAESGAHQFSLGLPDLVVQAAEDATGGTRMVVLDEADRMTAGFLEGALVVAFEEESAIVAEHPGFEEDDVGNCQAGRFHQYTVSVSRRLRYWP